MNESSKTEVYLEDRDLEILCMSEQEKQKVIKYDADGNPLYYKGDNAWVPVTAFVTKEEILEAKSRYVKPRIYPFKIIISVLIPIILGTLLNVFLYLFSKNFELNLEFNTYVIVFFVFLAFYIILNITNIAVFAIKLYQIFAPDEVRERCGLTPTCSTYTIIALEKYGFIFGMIKAIKRLKRCDGEPGEDWP